MIAWQNSSGVKIYGKHKTLSHEESGIYKKKRTGMTVNSLQYYNERKWTL